jgi:ABC-2 type transport system ATP-binding protein
MKKTAIKINNLIVKIRKHMILDRVKMTVPSNKITVFVGENGAGKTTTIKCILGLQRFNKGKIKIFTTSNKLSKSRKNLVYVPDKENFLPIKIRT